MNHGDEDTLQQSVEQLRGQLVQTALMYEERNRVVANQENQINALNNQVTSLKEVVSITRDLLQIRNMEVKQLQVSRGSYYFLSIFASYVYYMKKISQTRFCLKRFRIFSPLKLFSGFLRIRRNS